MKVLLQIILSPVHFVQFLYITARHDIVVILLAAVLNIIRHGPIRLKIQAGDFETELKFGPTAFSERNENQNCL